MPFPPPGDLPKPGVKPESPAAPAFQADSLALALPGKPTVHKKINSKKLKSKPKNQTYKNVRNIDLYNLGWESFLSKIFT